MQYNWERAPYFWEKHRSACYGLAAALCGAWVIILAVVPL